MDERPHQLCSYVMPPPRHGRKRTSRPATSHRSATAGTRAHGRAGHSPVGVRASVWTRLSAAGGVRRGTSVRAPRRHDRLWAALGARSVLQILVGSAAARCTQ